MAENKEITTLHPYMNRNKNRYPNVKEENIPDTIQRKLTPGTGINISPENVISATGGDSYTRDETDALLDTKADKLALENVNKVVPTDIAVKDGKLGLEHDTTWLTNQSAITLGTHLAYDAVTNTLDAVGGGAALPAGTIDDPFVLNYDYNHEYDGLIYHRNDQNSIVFKIKYYNNPLSLTFSPNQIQYYSQMNSSDVNFSFKIADKSFNSSELLLYTKRTKLHYILDASSSLNSESYLYVPSLQRPAADGSYNLQITKTGYNYEYNWVAGGSGGGLPAVPTDKTESYYLDATYDATSATSDIKWSALKKTFNHYIVINDGTTANAIYLLIPSTNNLKCNSLTDLNTLLGTAKRFIQASGVVTNESSKLPIVALNWQGSFATSKILTMSSEEAVTKFTSVVDEVEPA